MERLGLSFFVSGTKDLEGKQYLVLQALKEHYDQFSHNCLYPALRDLIELSTLLTGLLQKHNDMKSHLPQEIKEIDLENNQLVFKPLSESGADLERAAELILWTLPYLKKAIEEGMEIYNFVDEHIVIEEVGIVPMYREEGYWFVPEIKASLLHLIRYEASLFTSAEERYRTLKTKVLESIVQAYIHRSPESIKLELIQKYHDLPNPATYVCQTDLEFPYTETILPIAKRKLMKQLFS
jgi:hypothetical protein